MGGLLDGPNPQWEMMNQSHGMGKLRRIHLSNSGLPCLYNDHYISPPRRHRPFKLTIDQTWRSKMRSNGSKAVAQPPCIYGCLHLCEVHKVLATASKAERRKNVAKSRRTTTMGYCSFFVLPSGFFNARITFSFWRAQPA